MNGTHHIIKPNNKVSGQNCNASEINNIVLYKSCIPVVGNETRLNEQEHQHSHIAHHGEYNSNIPQRHKRNALDINGEVNQNLNDNSYTKDPEEKYSEIERRISHSSYCYSLGFEFILTSSYNETEERYDTYSYKHHDD